MRSIKATLATVPERYQWASATAPELRDRVGAKDPIALIRAALSASGVVIVGPAGSGKTSLAVAILVEAAKLGLRGMFTSTIDLARARIEGHLGEADAPLVRAAKSAPVLVLDELGAETSMRGTSESVVGEVIRTRYDSQLATIFTSPFAAAQIQARYGEGVARRVHGESKTIELRAIEERRGSPPLSILERSRLADEDTDVEPILSPEETAKRAAEFTRSLGAVTRPLPRASAPTSAESLSAGIEPETDPAKLAKAKADRDRLLKEFGGGST